MATYAIGDIQGCYATFRRLLDQIRFEPARDRLWLVGDLVNRGPQSLATLRFVKELGTRVVTVSSGLHTSGVMDFADLNGTKAYDRRRAYSQSKLANLLFAYELQRRLEAASAHAISVGCHPDKTVAAVCNSSSVSKR